MVTWGFKSSRTLYSSLGCLLQYLLRNTLKGPNASEHYAPGAEGYVMLKEAVLGGPSNAITRYHEAGNSYIRPHEVPNPKMCLRALGYDANALYPSTMLGDMPSGKETMTHYMDPVEAVPDFLQALEEETWFGFVECDASVPPELREKFAELSPFFYNKPLTPEMVPEHMKEYQRTRGTTVQREHHVNRFLRCQEAPSVRSDVALVTAAWSTTHCRASNDRLRAQEDFA